MIPKLGWLLEYAHTCTCVHVVLVFWDSQDKVPQDERLEQQELIFSRFWRSEVPDAVTGVDSLGGCTGESAPGLFPSFWWSLAVLGVPWFSDTSPNLCLPLHMVFSLCGVPVHIYLVGWQNLDFSLIIREIHTYVRKYRQAKKKIEVVWNLVTQKDTNSLWLSIILLAASVCLAAALR